MSGTLKIKTFTPSDHFIKCVLYGASGSGKTYFAATAPKPIFASAEAGLLSTASLGKQIDFVEVKSVQDLRSLLSHLKTNQHGYETVVIDSISEINEIIKEEIEKKRGARMQLQDWGELAKQIKSILRAFRDLEMHVIFIAQEKVNQDDNGKVIKITPLLNGKAETEVAYIMDIVGYSYINKVEGHKIQTLPHELYLTKDRSNCIGNDAPLNFTAWVNAIKNMKVGEMEVKQVEVKEDNEDGIAQAPAAPRASHGQATEPLITAEQTKKLFAVWGEFMAISGYEQTKSEAIRKKTMERDYGKGSSTQLTMSEAADFIDRLQKKVTKLKAEKDAGNGESGGSAPAPAPTPKDAPEAPAATPDVPAGDEVEEVTGIQQELVPAEPETASSPAPKKTATRRKSSQNATEPEDGTIPHFPRKEIIALLQDGLPFLNLAIKEKLADEFISGEFEKITALGEFDMRKKTDEAVNGMLGWLETALNMIVKGEVPKKEAESAKAMQVRVNMLRAFINDPKKNPMPPAQEVKTVEKASLESVSVDSVTGEITTKVTGKKYENNGEDLVASAEALFGTSEDEKEVDEENEPDYWKALMSNARTRTELQKFVKDLMAHIDTDKNKLVKAQVEDIAEHMKIIRLQLPA